MPCCAAEAKTSKEVSIKIWSNNHSMFDISSLIVLVLNLKIKNSPLYLNNKTF